jgi:YjbE family integral membrane protein
MFEKIIADLTHLYDPATLAALLQVLVIDIALAGENAIVVGALAAGLPPAHRSRVIAIGIAAAFVLRVIFALVATRLLQIVGLVLAGGLLLLWVAWKMWREMKARPARNPSAHPNPNVAKSLASAAWSVALADVGMSLDNVLGVAGAAKDHPGVLVIGLLLSVALTGVAANIIARYLERYRWILWLGIGVVLWVAGSMIWDGLMSDDIGVLRYL